ncbi:MFS transporter [Nocardia carnea]|uniref:MFS transporter n=1 Tax=Nocardia carnea TaxID=37328 RepID=UPI0024582D64|nr:MFS transporter [Nocardia carnea]
MAADTGTSTGITPAALGTLVAAVTAVALNLRPGVTTVGPELDTLSAHFAAGARAAGVIAALPVFAFALVSLATPVVLARISVRTGLFWALTLTGAGLAVRPWAGLAGFVIATFLAAVGAGLATVLLPALIRSAGNTRILVTAFTTALQGGAVLGFATVVPLSQWLGWQWGLALWAVLAPAAAVALWRAQRDPSPVALPGPVTATDPVRYLRRTGTIRLATFFGLQALVAFVVIGWLPSVLRDAGQSAAAAGGYLALLTCVGLPVSLLVTPLVAGSAHPSRWLAGFSACSVAGIAGFLVAPGAAPLLWSLVLGAGLSVFSLALTVITLRAGTTGQAVLLSSAVQGTGYLVAALGPYAFGLLRHTGDGWTVPLTALLLTALAQTVFAATVGDTTAAHSDNGAQSDHSAPSDHSARSDRSAHSGDSAHSDHSAPSDHSEHSDDRQEFRS